MDFKRQYEATHVSIKGVLFDGRPVQIVLDTGDYVWVATSYADDTPEGVVQVGDGRSTGYSGDGQRILSVPAAWCKFLTDEEAECIDRCMEADARLLSYAY